MSKCANCNELVGEEWSANNGLCITCARDEVSKPDTNQASGGRYGDAPISDKEAWLRIFEATRAAVHATNIAIINTNDAFDAMKNKLEAEL